MEDTNTGLFWAPLHQAVEEHCSRGDPLLLILSPFIGAEALARFVETTRCGRGTKVVVRWRPEDLRAGISDVSIFPFLKERGMSLYINNDIHLKLYVFASNLAFSTSANLTLRGFGYSKDHNIEVGGFVPLTPGDWSILFRLINNSRIVDDALYAQFKDYVDRCSLCSVAAPERLDLPSVSRVFTISALPAMESPAALAKYYFAGSHRNHSPEIVRRATHDLITFGVPSALTVPEFEQSLGESFRLTAFVREFVAFLKTQKSLRFGAVNDWIHEKCEDVPLPYKWEIKENTHFFYNWLEHFVPEISWDRPNYSQVIYWRGQ